MAENGDNRIGIWDTKTGSELGAINTDGYAIFSPSGDLIASVAPDNITNIWDASTNELKTSFEGHKQFVYDLVLNHNETLVASASRDKTHGVMTPVSKVL